VKLIGIQQLMNKQWQEFGELDKEEGNKEQIEKLMNHPHGYYFFIPF